MAALVGDVFALDGADQSGPHGDDRGRDSELSLVRYGDGRVAAVWLQDAPNTPETLQNGQEFSFFGRRPYYSVVFEDGTVSQAETLIDFANWRDGGGVNPQRDQFDLEATALPGGGLAVIYQDNTKAFQSPNFYAVWVATVWASGTQTSARINTDAQTFATGIGAAGAGGLVYGFRSPVNGDPYGLRINGVYEGTQIVSDPQFTPFGTGYAVVYDRDSDPSSATNYDTFISFRGNGVSPTEVRVSESPVGRQLLEGTRGEQAATLRDGAVVVIWQETETGDPDRTVMRIFGPDGQPRTGELTLAQQAGAPTVVALDTGGFAVAYLNSGFKVRAFDADGAPTTDAFALPPETPGAFDLVDLGGGRVMVGWIAGAKPVGVVVDLQLPGVLRGTTGLDTLTGGVGAEQLFGLDAADTLNGGGGNDRLEGGAGDDVLDGGAADDRMFGGAGNDAMRGSPGADHYDGGGGTDVVNFNVSTGVRVFLDGSGTNGLSAVGDTFTGVENLIGSLTGGDWLVGTGDANRLTGNGGADKLWGRGGIDQLEGGAGTDELIGGAGADAMSGGADADRFVFDTRPLLASERDRISDFLPGTDKLQIDASAFGGGLVAAGGVTLIANASPSSAGQANGVFLYDTDTGFLSWDRDGGGAGAPVLFVWLQGAPALTTGDFLVVA